MDESERDPEVLDEDVQEAIEEAETEVEEAEQEVLEAETPSEVQAAEARLADAIAVLTARVQQAEERLDNLHTLSESYAQREHDHPMSPVLQNLHEHITEIEREETAPNLVPWWKRRVFG